MTLFEESYAFLYPTVSANFHPGHGYTDKNSEDDQHAESDFACVVGHLDKLIEEVIDRVALGAEVENLLLRDRKQVAIEGEVVRALDELLDLFERQADDAVCKVLHLLERRDRAVQLLEAFLELRGHFETLKFGNLRVQVDLRLVEARKVEVNLVKNRVDAVGDLLDCVAHVVGDLVDGLIESFAHLGADFHGSVKAAANSQGDQAEVGLRHHVDDEEDDLLNASDAHLQHGHEAADCLLNPRSGHFVDALRHVVGHGSHGATNLLHLGASTKGFASGGS